MGLIQENLVTWGHDFCQRALNYPFGCKISNEKLGEKEELVSSLGSIINFIGYVDFLETPVGGLRLLAGASVVCISPDLHKKMLGGLHAIRGGLEMIGSFEGHLLVLDAFFTLLQTFSLGQAIDESEAKLLVESDGFFEASFRSLEQAYKDSQSNPQKLLEMSLTWMKQKITAIPSGIQSRIKGFAIQKALDNLSSFYEARTKEILSLVGSGARAIREVMENPFGLKFRVREKAVFVLLGGLVNFLGYNDFLERKIGVFRLVASIGTLVFGKEEGTKLVALGHLLRAVLEMAGSYEKALFILDALATFYYFAQSISQEEPKKDRGKIPA